MGHVRIFLLAKLQLYGLILIGSKNRRKADVIIHSTLATFPECPFFSNSAAPQHYLTVSTGALHISKHIFKYVLVKKFWKIRFSSQNILARSWICIIYIYLQTFQSKDLHHRCNSSPKRICCQQVCTLSFQYENYITILIILEVKQKSPKTVYQVFIPNYCIFIRLSDTFKYSVFLHILYTLP